MGETFIEYLNGTTITFNLNKSGQFCGIQRTWDKFSNAVTIQHALLGSMKWVKLKEKEEYFSLTCQKTEKQYLSRDLKTVMHCKHLGKIYGIFCHEGALKLVDGFPTIDESLFQRDSMFDIHFPSNERRYKPMKASMIANKCHSFQYVSS